MLRRELDGPFDYNRYPPGAGRGSARGSAATERHSTIPSTTDMPDTNPSSQPSSSSGPNRRNPRAAPPGASASTPASRRRLPPHAIDELPRARSGPHHRIRPSAAHPARDRWAEQERLRQIEFEEDNLEEDSAGDAATAPLRRHRSQRAQRRDAPKRPFWKLIRLWAGVLLLLGLVELVAAALTSPQFAVAGVDISGLDVTPEETVRSITAQLEGRNWILAHATAIERQVERLPAVKQASIGHVLSWPPRLALEVEERRPFLKVGAGEVWWVVDNQGVPFRRAKPEDADLYAVAAANVKPRLGRALPTEVWKPLLQLATLLNEDNQLAEGDGQASWKLRRIYLDKNGFAALRLKGGAQDSLLVRLGDEGWRDKLRRARQALAYFQSAGARAQVLNLVSFNMPTWTPYPVLDREHEASNLTSMRTE